MTTLPCRAGGAPGPPLDLRSGGADTRAHGAGVGLSLPSLYPCFLQPGPRAAAVSPARALGSLQVFGGCVLTINLRWFLRLFLFHLCPLEEGRASACLASAPSFSSLVHFSLPVCVSVPGHEPLFLTVRAGGRPSLPCVPASQDLPRGGMRGTCGLGLRWGTGTSFCEQPEILKLGGPA